MRRFALFLAAFLALPELFAQNAKGTLQDSIAARPLADAFDSAHWITRPSPSGITVVGIAPRHANREQGIAAALRDAAFKVSLYYGVGGETLSILRDGQNVLDYYADSEYRLDLPDTAESYLDALVYDAEKDVYEKNGSVFVRARCRAISDAIVYAPAVKDGAPDWVGMKTVRVPGYEVGVGISKNRGNTQKTCRASVENAIVSLLSRAHTSVDEAIIDIQGRGRITETKVQSEGRLSKVIILETWFDRKTGSVWTLLAAKIEVEGTK